jgi:Family of unknown function (DUF6056)
VVACTGGALVVFAPGNEMRMEHFPDKKHLLSALTKTLAATLRYAINNATNPALWLGAGLLAALAPQHLHDDAIAFCKRHRLWIVAPLLTVTAVAVCIFPTYWSMGSGPPGRVLNTVFLVFMLGWFPSALSVAYMVAGDKNIFRVHPSSTRLLLIALALTVASAPEVKEAYKETGDAWNYRASLSNRERLIASAAATGERNVSLPALKRYPRLLSFMELGSDPSVYRNMCYARLNDLDSVRVQEESRN